MRDPVPMTLGDAGRFNELVAEVTRLIEADRQDPNAILRVNKTRLTIRLADAVSKEYTTEELRGSAVASLAADLLAVYRDEERRLRRNDYGAP